MFFLWYYIYKNREDSSQKTGNTSTIRVEDYDRLREMKSEPNLDKVNSLRGGYLKTEAEAKTPNNGKYSAGKDYSPMASSNDENKRGLGRSSSQKTIGPAVSKLKPGTKTEKGISDKLNSTVRLDTNISIDNSLLSVPDADMRKAASDKNKSPAKTYRSTISSSFKGVKSPTSNLKSILTSNMNTLSSPKAGSATKAKLNINSSPVPVKKKT